MNRDDKTSGERSDNVIQFPTGHLDYRASGEGRPACQHTSVLVDDGTHTVICKVCGHVLDPYILLRAYAKKERRARWDHAYLRRLREEINELEAQEQRLKRRVQRVKSVLRRLGFEDRADAREAPCCAMVPADAMVPGRDQDATLTERGGKKC